VIGANNQVERLESALRGACKLGDRQADEIIRLARAAFRQRSAIRLAVAIAKRGQVAEAISILEAELNFKNCGGRNRHDPK
jgi:hypothetical protein